MTAHDVLRALDHLETAYKRARQSRDALRSLLELAPDTHAGWLELTQDAEAIEIRLRCAIEGLAGVFAEDVSPVARALSNDLVKLA
jgi:hypothetical protein